MVDIQKPFYSSNSVIKSEFPNLAENVKQALDHARAKKMMVVHVRAVYNEQVSPWIQNFRAMNPNKWDCLGTKTYVIVHNINLPRSPGSQ